MKLLRYIFLALSTLLLAGALAAAIALPGPQRMLCPSCYGLETIAPNIYVDPDVPHRQHAKIVSAIKNARSQVEDFFGPLNSRPRIVVCRTKKCAQIFGTKGAKGIAYGWHAILLTNSSIFRVIAAHELAHIELHWRMGFLGWTRGTVPAWFNEGLATVISNDPRFRKDASPQAVRDVMQISSYLGHWAKHSGKVGWRTAYGAASTRVRQLERRLGRPGLKRFVERLAREGNLPDLLRRAASGEQF